MRLLIAALLLALTPAAGFAASCSSLVSGSGAFLDFLGDETVVYKQPDGTIDQCSVQKSWARTQVLCNGAPVVFQAGAGTAEFDGLSFVCSRQAPV